MDWDALSRENLKKESVSSVCQIPVKRVAVQKEDLIRLPDGTVIVRDKKSNT